MSDILTPQKHFVLNVDNLADHEIIANLGRAFSVPERVAILKSLLTSSKNLSMLSEELDMPVSSVARQVDILTEAGFIFSCYRPRPQGHT